MSQFQNRARLYVPGKPATQSGISQKHSQWWLEFASPEKRFKSEVMGWVGSSDTTPQVRISFNSLQAAEEYAKKHNIKYDIIKPRERKVIKKSYTDNFTK